MIFVYKTEINFYYKCFLRVIHKGHPQKYMFPTLPFSACGLPLPLADVRI